LWLGGARRSEPREGGSYSQDDEEDACTPNTVITVGSKLLSLEYTAGCKIFVMRRYFLHVKEIYIVEQNFFLFSSSDSNYDI